MKTRSVAFHRVSFVPESGWISFYLVAPEDVGRALELFQLSYDLAVKQRGAAPNAA